MTELYIIFAIWLLISAAHFVYYKWQGVKNKAQWHFTDYLTISAISLFYPLYLIALIIVSKPKP